MPIDDFTAPPLAGVHTALTSTTPLSLNELRDEVRALTASISIPDLSHGELSAIIAILGSACVRVANREPRTT
jgi:hypothetical protein